MEDLEVYAAPGLALLIIFLWTLLIAKSVRRAKDRRVEQKIVRP